MTVKFEKVKEYQDIVFNLPQRKTKQSAGYDFEVIEDIVVPSHYLNLLKIMLEHLLSDATIEELADVEIIQSLIELGEGRTEALTPDEAQKALNEVKGQFIPSLQQLRKIFTLDLEDLKKLVKTTGAKATLVPTGTKVYLEDNQKLELYMRSSTAIGAYLMMANAVGVVDSDYVDNPSNEGHIAFPIINLSPFDVTLKKGDVIGQGIISTYDKIDDDESNFVRLGGFGHTDEQQ